MIKDFFKKISSKNIISYLIIVAGILMGFYFKWNISDIFIFALFLGAIVMPFPSKYAAAAAMICLILAPIMVIAGKKDWSEQVSIYAYYFLVMAVILLIYEFHSQKEDKV